MEDVILSVEVCGLKGLHSVEAHLCAPIVYIAPVFSHKTAFKLNVKDGRFSSRTIEHVNSGLDNADSHHNRSKTDA